jgi:hypothetical protein
MCLKKPLKPPASDPINLNLNLNLVPSPQEDGGGSLSSVGSAKEGVEPPNLPRLLPLLHTLVEERGGVRRFPTFS